MPFVLDVRHESLSYVGRFAYPTLELWGAGGVIIKGLLDALAVHGVGLQHFQVSGNASNASEPVITVRVADFGVLKFSFDKIEFGFTNFTTEFFESIPSLLEASVLWIPKAAPKFEFVSHQFTYFTHAFVRDSTPEAVLKNVNVKELRTAGISLGHGAIFNYSVPAKNWETQLIVDRSQHLPGALFVNFMISTRSQKLDYAKLLNEGRAYLAGMLHELDLELPEASQ